MRFLSCTKNIIVKTPTAGLESKIHLLSNLVQRNKNMSEKNSELAGQSQGISELSCVLTVVYTFSDGSM